MVLQEEKLKNFNTLRIGLAVLADSYEVMIFFFLINGRAE